jgi:acyl-CoA synthetase (AMP-forming)/AMP-acid ligase II
MRAEQQPGQVAYTFAEAGGGEQQVTYSELDQRARAIAQMLAHLGIRGKRAMLLYPPGIDYIAAFFGCLYAGAIAVPACPPDPLRLARSLPRLVAVVRDAMPSAVLTTAAIGSLSEAAPELSRLRLITTGDVSAELAREWEPAAVDADSTALLQYTSGSTSRPKGVVLTHRNLISNSELIFRYFGHSEESRGMIWLPPYHDMGLIGGIIQPLYGGFPVTLMAPADFLSRPLRWLQEISRTRATTSGGPNFAYDLCVRKTSPEERRELDLSSWRVAFNGSEPIRAQTMEKFARAFAPAGFRREAFHPCYGLAEATLIVTGGLPWSRRSVKSFDPARSPRLVPSGLVPSGLVSRDRHVVIVDPGTRVERAPGQVGEIWISGGGVAKSYWNRPGQTKETFGARLAGTGEGPFMRSGDLGFVRGRELFVTGRMKDLIIIRGRNHHPHDIELTAERSRPVLRPGCAAAFTVADGDQERLVVAAEITRQAGDVNVGVVNVGAVAEAIRAAVAAAHGVQVHTVVLLPPGGMPKTSGGKIQRGLCAATFTGGKLAELGRSELGRSHLGRSELGQLAAAGHPHLDLSSLLSAPSWERQDLLHDFLCGLVAAACGIDAEKVVDAPLLALGVDSYAVISIQHSIETDLGVHLTASDLTRAASTEELAVRLHKEISADAAPADLVRLYCWVSGSRVPAARSTARSEQRIFLCRTDRGSPGRSAGTRRPAEEADREQQPGRAPSGHNEDVRPAERRPEERGLHPHHEVPHREDAGDPQDPRGGVVAERDEDPGQELQRQDDRVDDRGRGVGVRDDRGEREPERAERGAAHQQGDGELQQRDPGGNSRAVEDAPERRCDDDQQYRDEQRVQDLGAEERPGGQRRPVGPLEHPVLALEADHGGDVVEARRYHREGGHRGHVVGGGVHRPGADVNGVMPEQRGEDHQEHEREREGEEGQSGVPPERLVDVAEPDGGQPDRVHAAPACEPVSDR